MVKYVTLDRRPLDPVKFDGRFCRHGRFGRHGRRAGVEEVAG